LTRVVLGGEGLATFEASPQADSYVKLVFLPHGAGGGALRLDDPRWALPGGAVDLDVVRATLPADQPVRMRTYTVRAYDAARCELTLDLVVHGDVGLAGPWAATAAMGDEILVVGPGGGYSPDPAADRHLLVGDASALPAIAVALERLAADAVGHAVIEVLGVEVRWVHQGSGVAGLGLVDAVRSLPWPAGRVHGFVHGEAGTVRELRRYLRVERDVPGTDLSISGYWRVGADDEAWRAGKREWLRAIEESESASGVASAPS
jgi:NADPH-dependent ferric siderophore reductase